MKPCSAFSFSKEWLDSHLTETIPTADDEEFFAFIHKNYEDIAEVLELATSVVYNGINQSFIDLAKPLYPNAIAHCEFYISSLVKGYYCNKFEAKDADKIIVMSVAYFLANWFEINSLRDAHVYSYRVLTPGVLLYSAKRRKLFEGGIFDKDINDYVKRNNVAKELYKQFVNKLIFNGVSSYLGVLNPHDHLDYVHAMDIFLSYLNKDIKRAIQLAMLYFPLHVINTVLKS